MSAIRQRVSTGGPQQNRPGTSKVFRGSKKRLQRIKWYEHTSIEFWVFVVLVLLMLFAGIPWMIHHPPDEHHRHVADVP
jgi:hypothetical protein